VERQILALPLRHGGLRLTNPQENPSYQQYTINMKSRIHLNKLLKELTPESQLIKGAIEKGASPWLSALPIKAIRFALNKQECMDAICMEGERHAHPPLCLWRDKLCKSQPHM